jgi:hypothetical protein
VERVNYCPWSCGLLLCCPLGGLLQLLFELDQQMIFENPIKGTCVNHLLLGVHLLLCLVSNLLQIACHCLFPANTNALVCTYTCGEHNMTVYTEII